MKLVAFAVLGACADSVAIDYDDIAQSVADASRHDVGAMTDSLLLASGDLPLGFHADASGAAHGTRRGLAYAYALTCRDPTGDLMAACNANADLADVTLSWSGATVTRDGRWSLAFLTSPTIKLAGTGRFAYAQDYELDYVAAYTAVMIDKQAQHVLSGTLHYAIAAREPAERAFSVDADVTLHGDDTATIVIDGVHAYALDLAASELEATADVQR
jgi:hypothetical protein